MAREVRTTDVALPPRVAASVRLEPGASASAWLVTVDGVPVSRASAAVAEMLRAMDGATSLTELHRRFAPDQPFAEFTALIDRFRRAGLFEGSERSTAGRVTYRPPLTVQFATLRAPQLFDVVHRLVRPIIGRWMPWAVAVIVLLGASALVSQADVVIAALTSPLPLIDVAAVVIVLVAATFIHESAHGVALAHAGARPRRAGVMLLYLGPAFFVDVTDGWRLPSRASRVAVALAGPAVHAVLGGVSALSALAVADVDARRALLVIACACSIVVVINLVPFVRFDGYIALMSALDEPNLRARTMTDASAALLRLFFGAAPPPRALARRWSVPFGVLSVLVPTALVFFALERAVRSLSGAGAIGAVIVLVLQAAVLVAIAVPVGRWLVLGIRRGPRRMRGILLGTALILAIFGATATVPVAETRTAGFVVADGRAILVVPDDVAASAPLSEGAAVALSTGGIVADAPLTVGSVHPEAPSRTSVPISAFIPVEVDDIDVDAVVVGRIDIADGVVLPPAGRAHVQLGVRSALVHAWVTHVAAPFATLFAAFLPSFPNPQEGRT